MKKIIMLLFSFIMLTSVTACSESSEKLYGFYKDINEKRDKLGYIRTIRISEKEITDPRFDILFSIFPLEKNGEVWVARHRDNKNFYAEIKEIAPNTIEFSLVSPNKKDSFGSYIKINEDEYRKIRNTPKVERIEELPLF